VHPLPDLALAPRHYRLMTIRTPDQSPVMARIHASGRIPVFGCLQALSDSVKIRARN
jgi:hypothetical protein